MEKWLARLNRNPRRTVFIALAAWTLVNLLQAIFTELFHDEAYYWVYSRELAWGYYDHAPMIALMIRLGTAVLSGEPGVRLLVVAASSLSLYGLYILAGKVRPAEFFLTAFAVVFLHVGGFFAAPDIPMILFGVFFFIRYREYLRQDTLRNTLLLTLAVTLLVYSKYHGLMLLFFTFLSFPALIKKKSFWTVVALSTLLYLPHLVWLYKHDFATFGFHLGERSSKPYQLNYTLDYLSGVLGAAGLIGLVLFPAALLRKAQDRFERALSFSLFGILILLFFLTFKGRVEANWAAGAFIPLVVLGHRELLLRNRLRRWAHGLALASIPLLLVFRLYLGWDFFPSLRSLRSEFHGWPEWAEQVREVAGDRPVVFADSYQLASKYWFYTGIPSYAFNSPYYRSNQFDLLNLEEQLQGKRVLYVTKPYYGKWKNSQVIETAKGDRFICTPVDFFAPLQKLNIRCMKEPLQFQAGTEMVLPVEICNPYPHSVTLPETGGGIARGFGIIYQRGSLYRDGPFPFQDSALTIPPGGCAQTLMRGLAPDEPGNYRLYLSLRVRPLPPGRQGKFLPLKVISNPDP